MSGRKSTIKKFQSITAGDMSQASITSAISNIQFLDNIGIQLNFTGAPVGTFSIEVSADYEQQEPSGAVKVAGTWVPITLTPAPVASGAAGSIYLDLNQLSAPWIRVVYTKTSGTGSLDCFLTAKML